MLTKSEGPLPVDIVKLNSIALCYRAINNKTRLKILRLIHKKERISVSTVYKTLKIDQSAASAHLAILRRAQFVNAERDGIMIFYSINYKRLKLLHDVADTLELGEKYAKR